MIDSPATKRNSEALPALPPTSDDLGPDRSLRRPFLNRELSRLSFNARVLAQALDPRVPLLERLKFLAISSSNLDEFFEIRVSRLQQQVAYGVSANSLDGLGPQEVLDRIAEEVQRLVAEQYRVLQQVLLPELAREGIVLVAPEHWSAAQTDWAQEYFRSNVLPILTPIGLDPAHPFPNVQNKNLILVVSLDGADAFGRRSGIAIVQVPRVLPRVLRVPQVGDGKTRALVLLSSMVQRFVGELFPGMAVTGCVPFRITRDSDLFVAEEETDDLLEAMKGELTRRNDGDAVRIEVGEGCTPELAKFLLSEFELDSVDLYRCPGPVNLHRLAALADLAERPDLRWPPLVPRLPKALQGKALESKGSIFNVLRQQSLVLHQPYDSAAPVIEMLRQAASDPDVLAIKQTLYRTGPSSPFVKALVQAARAGKDVTAVVELRARFDEADNISLATELQDAGANVVYGVVGHKTHAKMLLIVRREAGKVRRYAHLGTGNYHPATARLYTDISLLTADELLTEDVHQLFLTLTGLGSVRHLERLLQSPFTMHIEILRRIEHETALAKAGLRGRIVAKMNALTEPGIIRALYRASQMGVQIDLIIRGICCLVPGVPGLSENVRVRSIVGRFLEHARVWWFGASDTLYCSSADWMERNLHRRVEAAFPIDDKELRRRVRLECLEAPLEDTLGSWLLQPDGSWRPARDLPGAEPFSVQEALLRGEIRTQDNQEENLVFQDELPLR